MKITGLLLLLLSSLAHATDHITLSENISENIQYELQNVPAGKYSIALMATYRYKTTPEGPTRSTPVFLSTLRTYELPNDLLDCRTKPDSLVCAAAIEFKRWYKTNKPAPNGDLNLKFIMFDYCDGYLCPFYKEAQISVKIND